VIIYQLSYYLQGKCKEVIICQIRDREGFQTFQSRLSQLQIPFEIEEISAEVYEFAQRITRQRGDPSLSTVGSSDITAVDWSGDFCSKQSITYSFPLCPQQHDIEVDKELCGIDDTNKQHQHRHSANADHLLTTNKESFVIMRILQKSFNREVN